MENIKSATACYTGGGIYIYYGQLESGLFFRAADGFDAIYICDSDTSAEEADYWEFYEAHTVAEITNENEYTAFWNAMISHILNRKPSYGKWNNYDPDELQARIIK